MTSEGPFTSSVLARLQELGLSLPQPAPPAGMYEAFRLHRGVGFLASQFPSGRGLRAPGATGSGAFREQGREAARLAALSVLARIRQALGGFDRLTGLLRVDGTVAAVESFSAEAEVLDGASETFLRVLGERGKHVRTAVTVPRLVKGNSVKLVATFGYEE
jgi:enamine deaminase RidA (YjgF/YER057c/UK114 family)